MGFTARLSLISPSIETLRWPATQATSHPTVFDPSDRVEPAERVLMHPYTADVHPLDL